MGFGKSAIAGMLVAVFVAGCGGGGGGSAGPGSPSGGTSGTTTTPVVADGSWLTLTPGTVSLKTYQGETVHFTVRATSSKTFDKPFNVAVIDDKGLVSPQISISKQSDLDYIVGLQTAMLAAGTHTTRLQVRLCEDDPKVCAKPLPGSPWSVPLTVDVAAAAQAQERMTFTPAAPDLVAYEGEPMSMQLGITVNSTFDVPVSVGVSGGTGVLAPGITVTQESRTQYRAKLTTLASLAQGDYTASLEVRLCYDNASECKNPVVGSPWRVPVKVAVKAGTNLTTLAAIPGLAPWSNADGNAAHNAYVPASFDPARFTRRWSKPDTELGIITAPAIENGKLFTVASTAYATRELIAIDEGSGNVLWRSDLGAAGAVNPPAVANGRVFVTSPRSVLSFSMFDQALNILLSTRMNRFISECRSSLTVADGMVYSSFDRVSKYDPAPRAVAWDNALDTTIVCAPAVDGALAYVYTSNQVRALNTADGSTAYTIADQGAPLTVPVATQMVLGDGMGFVIDHNRLLGFDLRARTRAWVIEGKPVGQAVVANGIVYSLAEDGNAVEARAAATGALQWKSVGLTNWSLYTPFERMVVTSNLLFVSAPNATVALDLATRQVVWSYPLGGELAISDRGVLYIFGTNGKQVAINLR
ncbi:PQQ-binding-like beta-propeller repeat protein [Massilia suwonensis]|uniref:PQQ-binding-like beta-propeller repeat protein n=1 Tax=Massilia suwonensis TaxID=648895 RepID=A0ABW0MTN3_9BURK